MGSYCFSSPNKSPVKDFCWWDLGGVCLSDCLVCSGRWLVGPFRTSNKLFYLTRQIGAAKKLTLKRQMNRARDACAVGCHSARFCCHSLGSRVEVYLLRVEIHLLTEQNTLARCKPALKLSRCFCRRVWARAEGFSQARAEGFSQACVQSPFAHHVSQRAEPSQACDAKPDF